MGAFLQLLVSDSGCEPLRGCGASVSRGGGLSCGAQALGAAAPGLNSCGTGA